MADVQRKIKMKRAADLFLHGERVYLRRPMIDDAANVFRWERDDEVWFYDPHRPYSHSMAEFLPIFKRNYIHGDGHQCWLIIEDEQHVPIGTITYFNVDTHLRQVEVGLGLGEKTRWGQGYGPDAIATLVRYLFTFPHIERVYAETAIANHPARRAFAKAGFAEVGQIFDPHCTNQSWLLLEIYRSNAR